VKKAIAYLAVVYSGPFGTIFLEINRRDIDERSTLRIVYEVR